MQPVTEIKDIEYEIKKALKILKAMPRVGPRDVKSHWPQYLNEESQNDTKSNTKTYTKPLPQEIDDMDEVLEDWLKQLEFDDRNLVIMRNSGYGWKTISLKLNRSRSRLYDIYVKNLKKILQYVLEKQRKNSAKETL